MGTSTTTNARKVHRRHLHTRTANARLANATRTRACTPRLRSRARTQTHRTARQRVQKVSSTRTRTDALAPARMCTCAVAWKSGRGGFAEAHRPHHEVQHEVRSGHTHTSRHLAPYKLWPFPWVDTKVPFPPSLQGTSPHPVKANLGGTHRAFRLPHRTRYHGRAITEVTSLFFTPPQDALLRHTSRHTNHRGTWRQRTRASEALLWQCLATVANGEAMNCVITLLQRIENSWCQNANVPARGTVK